MEFPEELENSDVLEALIQHSADDDVIGQRIDECLRRGDPSSWSDFLRSNGLEDRETLNHVARSGACQFTAVADQLFRPRPVTETFRPDVYLRLLALHCVSQNQNAFQDFMLNAAPVTRQQRQRGGGGVDMEEYTRRKASSRCDGDHITLQALCDVLKVNINVVKWTGDDDRCPSPSDSSGASETPSIDAHVNPAGDGPTQQAAGGSAKPPTAAAAASGAGELATSEVVIRPRRSVFVADTLRPRDVAMRLDPRVRGVQLRGRTLWLSLQGEAHFRSLRLRGEDSRGDYCAAAVVRREEGAPLPRERSEFPSGRQASAESGPAAMVSPNPPPFGNIAIGGGGDVASPQDMLSPPVNGVSGGTGVNGGADTITPMTTPPVAAPAVGDARNAGGDGCGVPARVGGEGADIITTRDTLRDEALEEETGRERQEGKEDEGKGDKGEEEEEECSICMCTVTGEAEAASLDNCVHAFHFGCITKWGETTNQCPMCKARFYTVTRLRDRHVKRFRGKRRRAIPDLEDEEEEQEEPVAAQTVCLFCGDGGSEDRLILCDGLGCENGAHTFCCGLEEVPSGEWFCPSCQASRDAADRRDAILARAWAVDSGSDADGGHDSSAEEEEKEEDEEKEEEDEEDEQESVSIGLERTRRGRAMDAGRLDAFERGLVNSSGDSVGDEESDESEDEVIGSAREDLYGDGDVDGNWNGDEDGEGAPLYLVDLVSSPPEDDEDEVLGSVRRASSGLTRERQQRGRGRGGRRQQSTRGARGGNSGEALLRSRSSSGSRTPGARRRARIEIAATSSRGRGRERGGRGGRTREDIFSAPGVSFGAFSSTVGSPGPNLWPIVLASATSAVTPRHVFADFEEEKKEEEEEDQGRQGVVDNLVVQSWADAERARRGQVPTARRTGRRGETSSATMDRLESRGRSSRGQVASRSTFGSGTLPRPSVAARPSGASTAAAVVVGPSTPSAAATAPVTTAASPTSRRVFKRPRMMSASSTMHSRSPAGSSSSSMLSLPSSQSPPSTTPSAEGIASPAPRRVFKRPRLMGTSSSTTGSSSSPSPPLPLSSRSPPSRPISPGIRGIDSSRGFGATVDGIGAGRDGASSSAHGSGSGSADVSGAKGPRPSAAATGVHRLGQWQARVLVRRLREVAISQKERRSGRSAGRFVGGAVVAATGMRGGDGESKVNETLEELKRVVLGGDAITMDMLLSSQLLTALRLWLEPVENGSTSILPDPQQRSCLLKVLRALPVQKNHLKESGVGKLVVAMAAGPYETQENRELAKQIVRRWTQLVFRAPANDSLRATSFQSPNQGSSRLQEADQMMDGMTGGRGEALRSHGARPASSPAGTPSLPSTPTRRLNHGVVTPSPASPASLRRAIPASETKEEPERERHAAEWGYSGSGSGDVSGSRACKRSPQREEWNDYAMDRGGNRDGEGERGTKKMRLERIPRLERGGEASRGEFSAPLGASPVGQEIGIIARHTSGPTRRRLTDGSPLASASTDASRASASMSSGPSGFLSARGSPTPRSSASSRASHLPARSPAAPSPEHR